MGFSYSLSLNAKLRQATPRRQLVVNVIRRSLILVFLGLVINSHEMKSGLSTLRFPGVLQRLGVTYLVAGLVESLLAKRTYGVEDVSPLRVCENVNGNLCVFSTEGSTFCKTCCRPGPSG